MNKTLGTEKLVLIACDVKNDMIDSSHVNRGQRPDYLGKEAFVFMNDSLQYYNQHAKEFS